MSESNEVRLPEPRSELDEPQTSLDVIRKRTDSVVENYGTEPEFAERVEKFTKQAKVLREAKEAGLITAEEHDTMSGILMAEKDRGQEVDELTDIYRRGAFLNRLSEQSAAAQRNGTDLTVAFFDIDHFKKFNDKYSHEIGDAVLQQVAGHLRDRLKRETDIVGRYGGEEIGLILANMNEEAAIKLLTEINNDMSEVVKEAIAEMGLAKQIDETDKITASIGVAQVDLSAEIGYPDPIKRGMEALKMADERMYLGKENGRNQVVGSSQQEAFASASTN